MTAEDIEQYLREVGDELALQNVKGEICLYGGAVVEFDLLNISQKK